METKKKYQSKRLKGMQSEWTDTQFLEYVMFRVDFRSSNNELYEASAARFLKIIERLNRINSLPNLLDVIDAIELIDTPQESERGIEVLAALRQKALAK